MQIVISLFSSQNLFVAIDSFLFSDISKSRTWNTKQNYDQQKNCRIVQLISPLPLLHRVGVIVNRILFLLTITVTGRFKFLVANLLHIFSYYSKSTINSNLIYFITWSTLTLIATYHHCCGHTSGHQYLSNYQVFPSQQSNKYKTSLYTVVKWLVIMQRNLKCIIYCKICNMTGIKDHIVKLLNRLMR